MKRDLAREITIGPWQMAPKMHFRETDAACNVVAATFNDDDADALGEMMQLMELNYSAANARNAGVLRRRTVQWSFVKWQRDTLPGGCNRNSIKQTKISILICTISFQNQLRFSRINFRKEI